MTKSSRVIVIPVYKQEISVTEKLSLTRCLSVFDDVPVVLVGPLSFDYTGYPARSKRLNVERFADHYFVSLESYSSLLLSEEFYTRFSNFEFMLIYQLDAFVFTNQLDYWCAKGFDFIGAPWFDEKTRCWTGVGNGGFSLRRISASLGALRSKVKEDPDDYWKYVKSWQHIKGPLWLAMRYPQKILKHLGIGTSVSDFIARFLKNGCPEDMFWGLHAARYYPGYKVAPVEEAVGFAIEAGLEMVISRYKLQAPFGCHREWYLKMLHNYLLTNNTSKNENEAMVWELARISGLERNSCRESVVYDLPARPYGSTLEEI